MAVFTPVSPNQARGLMRRLRLGELQHLHGIQGGIENTNYFVTVQPPQGDRGATGPCVASASKPSPAPARDYVLTLFERLTTQQLPFYLQLMRHLAHAGIPVPEPRADASGRILHTLCGKPAVVVNRLDGASQMAPQPVHCAALGNMLARMHLAGRAFDTPQSNLRGLTWWNAIAPAVAPHLDAAQAVLLQSELAYQNHVAASSAHACLPRGPIHADLFRDNVLFQGERLTGLFDFYFAGVDAWLFDVAVCLNDWCVDLHTGTADAARTQALLDAYTAARPFTVAEHDLLPAMLRAAALRFWLSRLWDFHLPRDAALLQPHDPTHFERVLRARLTQLQPSQGRAAPVSTPSFHLPPSPALSLGAAQPTERPGTRS